MSPNIATAELPRLAHTAGSATARNDPLCNYRLVQPVAPDFVTHYHLASRPPLLNLCDLPEDRLELVIAELEAERAAGLSSRVFGRRYMELRRRTEGKLRALFVAAGGRPKRAAPHYFVLGESRWFQQLAADMSRLTVPIADLPSEVTSFTYPDSFTAMGIVVEYGIAYERRPYHERVFRIEELAEVIGLYGLPPDEPGGYGDYHRELFERYVEVQVWSDDPLRAFLPG